MVAYITLWYIRYAVCTFVVNGHKRPSDMHNKDCILFFVNVDLQQRPF